MFIQRNKVNNNKKESLVGWPKGRHTRAKNGYCANRKFTGTINKFDLPEDSKVTSKHSCDLTYGHDVWLVKPLLRLHVIPSDGCSHCTNSEGTSRNKCPFWPVKEEKLVHSFFPPSSYIQNSITKVEGKYIDVKKKKVHHCFSKRQVILECHILWILMMMSP